LNWGEPGVFSAPMIDWRLLSACCRMRRGRRKPEVTRGRESAMPTKRGPKNKAARRPATERVANGRGNSDVETMAASLGERLNDDTLDLEFDYYLAHLSEWYDQEGEHVLIHGQQHFGFFTTRHAAREEGFRRFGHVPILVKQVQRDEKPRPMGWVIF
jgi:hypothetical protein